MCICSSPLSAYLYVHTLHLTLLKITKTWVLNYLQFQMYVGNTHDSLNVLLFRAFSYIHHNFPVEHQKQSTSMHSSNVWVQNEIRPSSYQRLNNFEKILVIWFIWQCAFTTAHQFGSISAYFTFENPEKFQFQMCVGNWYDSWNVLLIFTFSCIHHSFKELVFRLS
jgi:hypothetical protein